MRSLIDGAIGKYLIKLNLQLMALELNTTVKDNSGNSYTAMYLELRISGLSTGVDKDGDATTDVQVYIDNFKDVANKAKEPVSCECDYGSIAYTFKDVDLFGTKTTPKYMPSEVEEAVKKRLEDLNAILRGKIVVV